MKKTTVKVVFNNTPDLIKALSGSQLLHAATNAGLVIQNYARMYAPVDTGALKTSILTEKDIVVQSGAYVNIGTPMEYANMQEFGGVIVPKTAKRLFWIGKDGQSHSANAVTIRPQPYMRPAYDNHKKEIMNAIEKAVTAIIRRTTR